MSFGSSFHSAWGGSGSWPTPRYRKYQPVKRRKKEHDSLLGNFVRDVRDAAVGIPMGLVELGKAEYHDVGRAVHGDFSFKKNRKLGSAIGKSMAHTYSPLVHGDFGEFAHRVKEHPLAPILDALSVATVPIGGLGVGIKTADTLATAARGGRAISVLRKTADAFRPIHSRELTAVKGAPIGYRHYAANPSTRLMQKMFDRSTSKVLGLTDEARHTRWLDKTTSSRSAATDALWVRQFRSVRKLFGDSSVTADDIARSLDEGIGSSIRAHVLWVPESQLLKGTRTTAKGWQFAREHAVSVDDYIPKSKDLTEFVNFIKTSGVRYTTSLRAKALTRKNPKTGEREFAVVRNSRDITREAERGLTALKVLHEKPLKVWKWMVLATAPRYFVNNVVGNTMMYAFSANPVAASRGMYHAVADLYGKRAALRGLKGVDREMKKLTGDWVDRWYLGTQQGFGYDIGDIAQGAALAKMKDGKVVVPGKLKRAGQVGLYGVTHYVSDLVPRRAAINYLIKRRPEYQAAYRAARQQGMSARKAHMHAADEASKSAEVRDWVSRKAEDILGQYHHFSKIEKGARAAVPFYSWSRAITRHTKSMVLERPYEAVFLARLGQQGTEEAEKVLGKVPDFMKGAIPLESLGLGDDDPTHGILSFILGQKHGNRKKVLSTQGLNPYATLAGIAETADSLVEGNPKVGEAVSGQLNPFATSFIEGVTGKSILSGAKIPPGVQFGGRTLPGTGGLAQSTILTPYAKATIVKVIDTALHGRPHAKRDEKGRIRSPLLYRQDLRQQLSSLMGVPIREFSPEKAAEMYRREQGITKSRRRRRKRKYPDWSSSTFSTRSRYRRVYRTHVRTPSRRKPRFPHPRPVIELSRDQRSIGF